jgi:capsular exopolysaccharide synthesis family protein
LPPPVFTRKLLKGAGILERLEQDAGVNNTGEQELDLREVLWALLERWWLVAVFTLVFPAIAYFYTSYTYVPQYTATASMVVNSMQTKVVNGQLVVANDVSLSKKLVDTYSIILTSDRVLQMVARDLGLNLPPNFMKQYVSVATAKDSEVLGVMVRNTDPWLAAGVCNSIMKVAPAAIAGTVEVGSVNVVDYAKIPVYPEPPAAALNATLGAMLGLLLGGGLALLLRYSDRTIKNDEDVKERLGLNVLGCIPQLRKGQAALLSSPAGKEGRGSWVRFAFDEAYKVARTNLQYAAHTHKCRKLLITSTLNGEGKSTTAANFAISLAQSGKSVLVIDCDLRKEGNPGLLEPQLEEGRGLARVLAGELDAADVAGAIAVIEGTGVSLLTAGAVVPNPSELLGSGNMAKLLALLEQDYDYILLDTPPACLFTDAVALSQYSDGVILVVKQSYARLDTIYLTMDNFISVNARILGCVLNGVKYKKAGYGYKYRNYGRYLSHYYKEKELSA